MKNIPATQNQQIFLALQAAAFVIKKMDMALTADGKGMNLSNVPAFYGVDFPSCLEEIAESIPHERKEKDYWKRFFVCNE